MSVQDTGLLSSSAMKGRITVFSIVGCPYCKRAKAKLEELNLVYQEVNLDAFPDRRREMQERTNRTSVPQIFFNARYLGGYDELVKAEAEGTLQSLIDEVMNNEAPDGAPLPPIQKSPSDDSDQVFELDEYAQLVREIRQTGLISDHRYHLRTYKSCFVGSELVDWLVANKNMTRDEAVQMGTELVNRRFGHHVTNDHDFKDGYFFYRLLEDDENHALNNKYPSEHESQPAPALGEALRRLILKLYAEFLSDDGRKVDYVGIAKSELFEQYEKLSADLQRVDVSKLSREETLAFFINIYNALVIHGTVVLGPATSTWQRYKFFNTVSYMIGGSLYSLQDIENGVLRGNRKGIGQLRLPFSRSDPRLQVSLDRCEPRIHFALVCGAKSCPPIKTYSAESIDEGLDLATSSFLDGDACQINQNEVSLTRILKWYAVDFGINKHEMLAWVVAHMSDSDKKTQLAVLLKSRDYRITFQTYDWGQNSK